MNHIDRKKIFDNLDELEKENRNLRKAVRWLASAVSELARDMNNDYLKNHSRVKVGELLDYKK